MPAIRTVSNIKSNLLRPALTSHFEVEVGIPNGLRSALGIKQDKLNLMCCEASLPGSQLATTEITNDFTGVTERYAYRRIYDERIDLNFYVDAENYIPIKFFEAWLQYISNEDPNDAKDPAYFYRMRYPDGGDGYTATGLKIKKFERDHSQSLEYEFIKSYPLSITSMPVSYDASSLLKCNISMTYIRYVVNTKMNAASATANFPSPFNQAQFNSGGLSGIAATFANAAVDRFSDALPTGANDLLRTVTPFFGLA